MKAVFITIIYNGYDSVVMLPTGSAVHDLCDFKGVCVDTIAGLLV